MKIPEIPTDNLYKFMAISGIIIAFASFVPFFFQHKLYIQSIQLAGEKLILLNDRESLVKKSEKIIKDGSQLRQKLQILDENIKQYRTKGIFERILTMKEFKKLSDDLENLTSPVSEYAQESEELIDEFKQLKSLTIQIATKDYELSYINKIITKGVRLFHFGALSGLILSVIGFSLWYKKLQLPLDMSIKNKLKDEQNNK